MPDAHKLPLTIGVVHPGTVTGYFAESLAQFLVRYEIDNVIMIPCGPLVAAGRNKVVDEFLGSSSQNLLFVDADIRFSNTAPTSLLYKDKEVVSGTYFRDAHGLVAEARVLDETKHRFVHLSSQDLGNGLMEVDAVGAGFLMIQREVLERMDESSLSAWFWDASIVQPGFGEDGGFSLNCKHLGVPMYVDPGVRLGHVKQMVL